MESLLRQGKNRALSKIEFLNKSYFLFEHLNLNERKLSCFFEVIDGIIMAHAHSYLSLLKAQTLPETAENQLATGHTPYKNLLV